MTSIFSNFFSCLKPENRQKIGKIGIWFLSRFLRNFFWVLATSMAYSRNDIGLHSRRSFSKTMNRALPWDPLLPHFPFTSKPSYSAIQLCLCYQPIPSFHRISMCITANVEQINSNGLYQVLKSDKNPAKIHNFAIIICRLICQKKVNEKTQNHSV